MRAIGRNADGTGSEFTPGPPALSTHHVNVMLLSQLTRCSLVLESLLEDDELESLLADDDDVSVLEDDELEVSSRR